MFRLADPVDYELDADRSLAAEAAPARRRSRRARLRPAAASATASQLLYLPLFNFAHGNFDDIHEMITSPHSLFGLSDAGAHCGAICDASMTTSFLTVWARDRRDGERVPIEHVVHGHTQRTAAPRRLARPGRCWPRVTSPTST